MCEPFTLGMMIAGSTAMSVAGSVQAGKAAQRAGNMQQDYNNSLAKREREIGALKAKRLKDEGALMAGRQRALMAAGGRDLSEGSALLVQTDLEEESAFNQSLAIAGAEDSAFGLEARGALARAEGDSALTTSYYTAGNTLLKGSYKAGQEFGN